MELLFLIHKTIKKGFIKIVFLILNLNGLNLILKSTNLLSSTVYLGSWP
jgi:hypothetical protein